MYSSLVDFEVALAHRTAPATLVTLALECLSDASARSRPIDPRWIESSTRCRPICTGYRETAARAIAGAARSQYGTAAQCHVDGVRASESQALPGLQRILRAYCQCSFVRATAQQIDHGPVWCWTTVV